MRLYLTPCIAGGEGGAVIVPQSSVFVIEGSLGFIEGDAVFLFVLLGFAIVPFKNDVGHTQILTV